MTSAIHISEQLKIGSVIEVSGSQLIIELDRKIQDLTIQYEGTKYPIGQFGSIIKIQYGSSVIFGFVSRIQMKSDYLQELGSEAEDVSPDARVLHTELFGEGCITQSDGKKQIRYSRGVANYPLPMQSVYITIDKELQAIFGGDDTSQSIPIGTHISAKIPCRVPIDKLLGRHTAILGSTGSGKSGTVSTVVNNLINHKSKKWNPHIVVLDPHGEYLNSIPGAKILDPTKLDGLRLPAWLCEAGKLFEYIHQKTPSGASAQWSKFKENMLSLKKEWAKAKGEDPETISIDSPIPFSLEELATKIDKKEAIRDSIDRCVRDRRMQFMSKSKDDNPDECTAVIRQFISKDHPASVIDLSAVPSEAEGVTVWMLLSLLFQYKVRQTIEDRKNDPVLVVCEEAHRYVPKSGTSFSESARSSVASIAKEGRKYGIGMIIVSQRPSEIESTVLSQCSSWIVMRLTNPDDQSTVKSFMPDGVKGLVDALPGLGPQEAILAGYATNIPSRIRVNDLPNEQRPASDDPPFTEGWSSKPPNDEQVVSVFDRWRYNS